MPYAADTVVPVERSEAELKVLLRKHGATRMTTGYDDRMGLAVVAFDVGNAEQGTARMVRLQVVVPSIDALEKTLKQPQGWRAWDRVRKNEWLQKQRAQIERQRWRFLVLLTKAKLEAIEQKLSTLEREFLADLVLPGGGTVYDTAAPAIAEAYRTGDLPPLLPGEVATGVRVVGTRPRRDG